jgi:hypothetical protein
MRIQIDNDVQISLDVKPVITIMGVYVPISGVMSEHPRHNMTFLTKDLVNAISSVESGGTQTISNKVGSGQLNISLELDSVFLAVEYNGYTDTYSCSQAAWKQITDSLN